MCAPVRELKRVILAGQFKHGGNPILRQCFANVVAEKDAAGNEKFTKDKARGRIDGCVAAAMAVGRILADEPTGDPGFVFVDSAAGFYG